MHRKICNVPDIMSNVLFDTASGPKVRNEKKKQLV